MEADRSDTRPQPCLTRRDGVVCEGTLLPVTEREWRCTEGHTMWGTARAMRSEPWPQDEKGHRMKTGWVQPWAWRWLGVERWHRLALGPLCLSIYPGRERSRWFVSHSWRYRNADSEWRHIPTFRRWVRARRAADSGSSTQEDQTHG